MPFVLPSWVTSNTPAAGDSSRLFRKSRSIRQSMPILQVAAKPPSHAIGYASTSEPAMLPTYSVDDEPAARRIQSRSRDVTNLNHPSSLCRNPLGASLWSTERLTRSPGTQRFVPLYSCCNRDVAGFRFPQGSGQGVVEFEGLSRPHIACQGEQVRAFCCYEHDPSTS